MLDVRLGGAGSERKGKGRWERMMITKMYVLNIEYRG